METNQTLSPFAPEIEEAVLGACLIERNALPEAMKTIRPEMFYTDSNREIYEALLALEARSEAVDILTAAEECKRRGTLEAVGGPYRITELSGKLASGAHLEYHCAILRKYYLRRQLILVLTRMQTKSIDLSTDLFDTIIETRSLLDTILDDCPWQSNLKTMEEVMDITISEGENRRLQAQETGTTGIPTGLSDLDAKTCGWQPGNVIYTAGRPGEGKTALDLFFAKTAAKAGYPVAYYSLEMSAREVGDRWMVSECDINPYSWKAGKLTAEEVAIANATAERMKQLPIHVDDTGYNSIDEICYSIKSLHAKGKCSMAIIDYLQLCRTSSHGRNREQEVAECSRKLKALARQINCPIIVSSQLNRQPDARPGQVPFLSDLRESGSIEQDADMVILLYRPKKANIATDRESGYPTEGLGVFIIAKHRNGDTGKVYFGHNPSMTKIEDYVPPMEWFANLQKKK